MKRLTLLPLIGALVLSSANAASTPKSESARYQIFRSYVTKLARQLGVVEIACAGDELPRDDSFKFCGVYRGDYFTFAPKWQRYAAASFTGTDNPWIQSGRDAYSGEAAARANHAWTLFGDFRQQTSSTAFVAFGMYKALEEH